MKTSMISYLLCIATVTAVFAANHGPNADPNPGFWSKLPIPTKFKDFFPKSEEKKAPEPAEKIPAKDVVIEEEIEENLSPETEVKVVTSEETKELTEKELEKQTIDEEKKA